MIIFYKESKSKNRFFSGGPGGVAGKRGLE